MKISDVEANNVESAMEFYREAARAGRWTRQMAHTLLHMQDNPDELIAAMAAERESLGIVAVPEPADWSKPGG